MTLEEQKELTRQAIVKELRDKHLVYHSVVEGDLKRVHEWLDSTMKLVGELLAFEFEHDKDNCDSCHKVFTGEKYQDKTGNMFVCQDCFDRWNDGLYYKEPLDKPLSITEFMKLPDNVKTDYFNRIFPSGEENKTDYFDHDIGIFSAHEYTDMSCEVCRGITEGWIFNADQYSPTGEKHEKFIGTGDSREPKYCFTHYAEVNKTSDFILFPDNCVKIEGE